MGNTITKDNDTLNWNNLKTDNFSDSLNNKYLSNDSKLLLSKLDINLSNIPNNETDSIDDIFSKYQSQSQLISNEFNTTTSLDNKNSLELSETSPFISSEMYNYLVKKNELNGNNNQKGGALNDDVLNDDSSTSETSESFESESELDSDYKSDKPKTKKPESKKPNSKKPESKKPESKKPESKKPESKKPESKKPESKKSKSKKPEPDSDYLSNSEEDEPKPKSDEPDSDEPDSDEPESDEREYNSKYNSNSSELSKDSVSNNDNLSYVSSPGNSLNSTDSNSEKLSGGSISNNNDYIPPSSINTSDINMISEAS
jgi:outer membrane biosynthesis protein TonB